MLARWHTTCGGHRCWRRPNKASPIPIPTLTPALTSTKWLRSRSQSRSLSYSRRFRTPQRQRQLQPQLQQSKHQLQQGRVVPLRLQYSSREVAACTSTFAMDDPHPPLCPKIMPYGWGDENRFHFDTRQREEEKEVAVLKLSMNTTTTSESYFYDSKKQLPVPLLIPASQFHLYFHTYGNNSNGDDYNLCSRNAILPQIVTKNTRRHFSSDQKQKPSSSPKNTTTTATATTTTTEPEQPVQETTDTIQQQQEQKQKRAHQRQRQRQQLLQNKQDEYFRYIESMQRDRTSRLRTKTATNVRRALYGNLIISGAKLVAWSSSGSSAMLSEFIHSVVDCGNQALLLIGLHDSGHVADGKHPYGYGKSMYFWALVSALGTFWLGAGIGMRHSVEQLVFPPEQLALVDWHVWAVLGVSLTVDGWVLSRTVQDIRVQKPPNKPFWTHVAQLRDPATLAILLEDGAACLGIVVCSAGIVGTAVTGNPLYDGVAGVTISGLLAAMGLLLVRLNKQFLLGQAVDRDIVAGIVDILEKRRSIDAVHSVQSQWTSPETFSFKAEVDFDGTYLAAHLLGRYQREFTKANATGTLDKELRVLLSWYAEDVMRTVEREIRDIEADIRRQYPGATYIELEPDGGKDSNSFAIDDGMLEQNLKKIELDMLNKYLTSLYTPGDNENDNTDEDYHISPFQSFPYQHPNHQDANDYDNDHNTTSTTTTTTATTTNHDSIPDKNHKS